MKPSLALLKKLATCADTEDAAPDLRAHVIAHADVYAHLLGAPSSAALAASVTEVTDDKLSSRVLATIRAASERLRDAKHNADALTRAAAAETVAATIRRSFLAWRLDREALLQVLEGVHRDARLRLVPLAGEECCIEAQRLRDLLKLRKDARPFLYPQSPRDPFVVHWGTSGRMTFRAQPICVQAYDVVIHLPMIDRLDGPRVELAQAAE